MLWGTLFLFFICIYLFTFLGNKFVGTPLTYSIVYTYIKELTNLLKAVNAPIFFSYTVVAAVLVCYFGFFILISSKLWNDLENLSYLLKSRKQKRTNTLVLLSLAVLVILFVTDLFKFTNLNTRLYQAKEPVYLVFSPKKIGNISLSKNKESTAIREKYPKISNFNKKNVVIIIVDDLRADYLSAYGYPEDTSPFLRKLVSSGKLKKVKYAYANGSASFSGILSILTSKLWTNIAQQNFAIHDVLKKQGYKVNFILSGDHTSFFLLRDVFGNNIDHYKDGFTSKGYYLNDDKIVIDDLKKVEINPENLNFFYLHLMSTHSLGIRLNENIIFRPSSGISKNTKEYKNNYKNGIVQTDKYINDIFSILESRKILDKSIVIITSDHGESLGEKGFFGHGNHVSNAETSIPLLIYDSDQSVNFYKEFATQEDISPTIADRLGLPIPSNWEGQSLLSHTRQEKYSYMCYKDSFAIVLHENFRLIKYMFNKRSKKVEVYDLKADPNENRNIINMLTNKERLHFQKMMQNFIEKTN